ncbi:cell division protein FtsQ [Geoalkalibacter ferrihydriticus]|uniref:Cell division protein FtsQ n=2 Tax=Geoalkalibacter ferrihydriticus TaxID=392333 RepID=A0A0C2HYX0_9BACT|nr:cell division protein FtsQ/DivIB [Geoalkalibacter ferrihydriticus]KIH77952.1 hypothetical protein GFER_04900 [Geoalkalibacter ferrihydriticus DSM 17813]SDM35623.1 cell division protein FtsQ [Geoalkalibacter ferrihydriticus]
MRDYKASTPPKVKKNKVRRERRQRDWRALFQKILRCTVTVVSSALIVGGALIAARMLVASDYFRIETVRVENAVRVGVDEVLGLSDIAVGSSIFDLNLEMIGRKIEENPWIRTARIDRIFPREVVIRIEEREPRAIVNLGYLYYLDAGGEVFKMLNAGDRLDYPVITGIARKDMLEQPEKTQERLRTALAVLDELRERRRFNLESVSEINLHPDEGIALYTYMGGIPVRLGEGDYGRKLDRLEHIYKELEPRLTALEYIDLKVPGRVIVKIENRPQRGRG